MEVRTEKQQPFDDIFDLAVSLSAMQFNRKIIEPLVKAGAFDDFGKDRAILLATIDAAAKQAEIVRPNEEDRFICWFYVCIWYTKTCAS